MAYLLENFWSAILHRLKAEGVKHDADTGTGTGNYFHPGLE